MKVHLFLEFYSFNYFRKMYNNKSIQRNYPKRKFLKTRFKITAVLGLVNSTILSCGLIGPASS